MKYVYIVSGSFGAQVLQNLDPKPTLVITMSDRLGGRGMKELIQTPVKKLCIGLKIHFVEVKSKSELNEILTKGSKSAELRDKSYELRNKTRASLNPISYLILLCDFRLIIPSELLKINEYGIWNIHPSLLPKYRGTTPIQTALINGEKITGVTLIQMDEKIDHGPVLAQEKLSIGINDTNITLQESLAKIGAQLFNEIASNDDNPTSSATNVGTSLGAQQDHAKATFTKKLTKEDGFIPLEQLAPYLEPLFKKYNLIHLLKGKDVIARSEATKQPNITELLPGSLATLGTSLTLSLHNKIRALTPWPSVWTKLVDDSVVKITGSKFDEESQQITITGIERNGKKYS